MELWRYQQASLEKIKKEKLKYQKKEEEFRHLLEFQTERNELLKLIAQLKKALEWEKNDKQKQLSLLERDKVECIQKVKIRLLAKMKRTKETLLTLRKEQLSATTRLSVLENH